MCRPRRFFDGPLSRVPLNFTHNNVQQCRPDKGCASPSRKGSNSQPNRNAVLLCVHNPQMKTKTKTNNRWWVCKLGGTEKDAADHSRGAKLLPHPFVFLCWGDRLWCVDLETEGIIPPAGRRATRSRDNVSCQEEGRPCWLLYIC